MTNKVDAERPHEFLRYSDSPYCTETIDGEFCNQLADAAVHQVVTRRCDKPEHDVVHGGRGYKQ